MNNSGYSNRGLFGSVNEGFKQTEIEESFATEVEDKQPQPSGCAF